MKKLKDTIKNLFKKEEISTEKIASPKSLAYLKKPIAYQQNISSLTISPSYALGIKIAASLGGDFDA